MEIVKYMSCKNPQLKAR